MSGFITIGQAAERLGVSRQTVINWANSDVIKIHKMQGKQYWLDEKSVEALADTAKETDEQMQRLTELKKQLRQETEKVEEQIAEVKRDLSIIGRTKMFVTTKFFYLSIPEMLFELDIISERERDVLKGVIEEDSLEEVAQDMGVTRERVRQIFVAAVRKGKHLMKVKEQLFELDKIKEENRMLKASVTAMQKELDEHHRIKEMNEEEKKEAFLQKDSLCRLLSTRVVDCELSVRTLNCLYGSGIKTIGDLVRRSKIDLLKLRNFGKRSLGELEDFVISLGLSFNMDVDKIFRERLELLNNSTEE